MGVAKNLLLLSMLIAGMVYAYLNMLNAKHTTEQSGGGAFQAHNSLIKAEVQSVASVLGPTVSVEESASGTHITIALDDGACNDPLLRQAYQLCISHRLQAHRDSNCTIEQADVPECQQP